MGEGGERGGYGASGAGPVPKWEFVVILKYLLP